MALLASARVWRPNDATVLDPEMCPATCQLVHGRGDCGAGEKIHGDIPAWTAVLVERERYLIAATARASNAGPFCVGACSHHDHFTFGDLILCRMRR